MKFKEIPLDQIVVKENIRLEADPDLGDLMDSIEQHEILQPVLVRPLKTGKYELVTGHRRYAAMKARNECTIPAVIRADITEGDRIFLQMVENGQRKQMSAIEWVEAFAKLKKRDRSYTNARIAKLIGRSTSWVQSQYDAARVAELMISEGDLSKKEARKLRSGQLIGRAQLRGYSSRGSLRSCADITVSMLNSRRIAVTCRDTRVVGMVLEAIDVIRDQVQKELANE